MKKVWLLILGLLLAYIAIESFIESAEMHKFFGFQIPNWIYQVIMILGSFNFLWEYYKANWGKQGIK
jgi:hypothetical protein